MFDVAETHPLSDFVRDPQSHVSRLRETKAPETLTFDGEAGIVVQDAEGYEALLEELERARFVESLRQAHQNYKDGKGIPLDEVEETLRAKRQAWLLRLGLRFRTTCGILRRRRVAGCEASAMTPRPRGSFASGYKRFAFRT